jgi:hypothetical protein
MSVAHLNLLVSTFRTESNLPFTKIAEPANSNAMTEVTITHQIYRHDLCRPQGVKSTGNKHSRKWYEGLVFVSYQKAKGGHIRKTHYNSVKNPSTCRGRTPQPDLVSHMGEHQIYARGRPSIYPKLPLHAWLTLSPELEIGKEKAKRKKRLKGDGKWERKVGLKMDSDNSGLIVQGIK